MENSVREVLPGIGYEIKPLEIKDGEIQVAEAQPIQIVFLQGSVNDVSIFRQKGVTVKQLLEVCLKKLVNDFPEGETDAFFLEKIHYKALTSLIGSCEGLFYRYDKVNLPTEEVVEEPIEIKEPEAPVKPVADETGVDKTHNDNFKEFLDLKPGEVHEESGPMPDVKEYMEGDIKVKFIPIPEIDTHNPADNPHN